MSEQRAELRGVVMPELPNMPRDDTRAFDTARQSVESALADVREQLKELRSKRDGTNAEIKRLVDEEYLLERMAKVRRSPRDAT